MGLASRTYQTANTSFNRKRHRTKIVGCSNKIVCCSNQKRVCAIFSFAWWMLSKGMRLDAATISVDVSISIVSSEVFSLAGLPSIHCVSVCVCYEKCTIHRFIPSRSSLCPSYPLRLRWSPRHLLSVQSRFRQAVAPRSPSFPLLSLTRVRSLSAVLF